MNNHYPPPKGLPPGSTVLFYGRDSGGPTQEQSVKQQIDEVRTYCEHFGLVLTEIFVDEAQSGKSTVGREGFNNLIDATKDEANRPDGLLIWNFARFARDSADSAYYKALLRKRGITIHSLTDPIPEGNYGHVVESIIDVANEENRRQNSRDVKRALQALVKQGFSCGGVPPKGYVAEKIVISTKRDGTPRTVSKWVLDPELHELATLAWRMRAQSKTLSEIQEATHGLLYRSRSGWSSFFSQ